MSIAEMIMQGTERQSKNWSVLSENLGRLGQQVGQQLALREYQKQAAESLPIIQEQMQAALQDAGAGRSADAYSKLLPLISNPAYTQNQFILPVLEAGLKLTDLTAQDSYKRSLMNVQYGRGGVMKPTYSLPTDEQLQSGEEFTPDIYQPQGPLPVMRDDMAPIEVDPKTGRPIADVNLEEMPQEVESVDRGFSFGVGAVSGGIDRGSADFISTDELKIPATGPREEDMKAVERWRSLTPEQQQAEEKNVVVSDAPKGKGKVVSFQNIPGVPFSGMVGENKRNIPTIKRKYTTEGKGEVTTESGAELNDYDTAAYNATVIGTRISGNKKLMDLLAAAGGNWNNVRISQETYESGEPVNYAFINGQKFDFPLTSVQMQKDTVPEAFGEVQMIDFVKNLPALADVNGWKLIEQKAPAAAAQPAAGGLPAVQAQAPAPAAPEIPEEAAGLQQIVAQAQAAKEVEQAKATENRIKDIDAEIKRLSPTTAGPQTRLQSEGLMPQKQKTPEQAQADIQKIIKLKAEKDALLGKKPLTQQEIKEGAIVEQGGKKYRFTKGKYIPID